MATLTPNDNYIIEEYLEMNQGYVLNFSNSTFRNFVQSITNIDIDHGIYCELGTSKANRLREFLRIENNQIVSQLLENLGEYKEITSDRTTEFDLTNISARFKKIIEKLREKPDKEFHGIQDNFWILLHKDLVKETKELFSDRYYKQAISNGCILLESRVKNIHKSKKGIEKTGFALMMDAMSESGKGSIQFNELSSETERDEQRGYMHISAGVMSGIRNPNHHELDKIDKNRAIHFLFIISLLLFKLDEKI